MTVKNHKFSLIINEDKKKKKQFNVFVKKCLKKHIHSRKLLTVSKIYLSNEASL